MSLHRLKMSSMSSNISLARQKTAMQLHQTIRGRVRARHIHLAAYISVVFRGGYEEAGDQGRNRVRSGDVIFHERFEAHLNRFDFDGAVVLNLNVPDDRRVSAGFGRIDDVDEITRLASVDHRTAVDRLMERVSERVNPCEDWEDLLCLAVRQNPILRLGDWAEANGIARWTVSRGFRRVFGVSPEHFRARVRARSAWKQIEAGNKCLASVAAQCGFADQAHMTRSVKAFCGATPGQIQNAANRCKTRFDAHRTN